mmetsp:Transcript_19354/g.26203  ORF Transcript_19354/g.26203 Transcript_19354/m.26203 type:complete len:176 (+) Transcript_19354:2221-2748(+)
MTSLREAPDEYDLDFASETVSVNSLRKLEKFSPDGVDADLMLASTNTGKLYLIGVFKADGDFFQEEIKFPGNDQISEVAETRDLLIMTTVRDHNVIIYKSNNLLTPSSSFKVNEGITTLQAIHGGALLVATLSGSLQSYDLSKVAVGPLQANAVTDIPELGHVTQLIELPWQVNG